MVYSQVYAGNTSIRDNVLEPQSEATLLCKHKIAHVNKRSLLIVTVIMALGLMLLLYDEDRESLLITPHNGSPHC